MIISISLGTFMSGIVDQLTGSLRNSIIIFAVIFIFGQSFKRHKNEKTVTLSIIFTLA